MYDSEKDKMYSFGSAIIARESKDEKMSLLWKFPNSHGNSDGYFYNNPTEIVQKDGVFYHLFFIEGYHPLSEEDINKPSDYNGDGEILVNPSLTDTSDYWKTTS